MNITSFYQTLKKLNQQFGNQNVVLSLEFKSYQKFKCAQCAACCKRDWHVHVSEYYYNKWQAHFDSAKDLSAHSDPFVKFEEGDSERFAFIKKKPKTTECIFLDSENMCYMQKNFGIDEMPTICRVFPRRRVEQGSVLKFNFLMPTCQRVPIDYYPSRDLNITVSQLKRYQAPNTHFNLNATQKMGYWASLFVRCILMDLLMNPNYSVTDNLRTVLLFLRELDTLDLDLVKTADIDSVFQRFNDNQRVSLNDPLMQTMAIQWFVRLLPTNIQIHYIPTYEILEESISDGEKQIIHQFIQDYLLNSFLILENWGKGSLTLYQEMLRLVIYALTTQILGWYMSQEKSSITPETLGEALNHVESYMSHDWIEKAGLSKLPPQIALKRIMVFLSLEFTLNLNN